MPAKSIPAFILSIHILLLLSSCSSTRVSEKEEPFLPYEPTRENPFPAASTLPKSRRHFLPSSHSPEPPHQPLAANESIYTTLYNVARSISSWFGFQQNTGLRQASFDIKSEEPADWNVETDASAGQVASGRALGMPDTRLNAKLTVQNDLEEKHNQEETGVTREISKEDVVQAVRLWRKMLKGIELALGEDDIPENQQQIDSQKYKVTDARPIEATNSEATERKDMPRENLPDVKLALAQAVQLNRRREVERQQKLAEFNNNGLDDDFTSADEVPRSAPSYPARVRLHLATKRRRWE